MCICINSSNILYGQEYSFLILLTYSINRLFNSYEEIPGFGMTYDAFSAAVNGIQANKINVFKAQSEIKSKWDTANISRKYFGALLKKNKILVGTAYLNKMYLKVIDWLLTFIAPPYRSNWAYSTTQ